MASARKKQDEKNFKILRELVSLPGNKHCFDCNQRGPTYVNMTIGSFVCTKCSGMLRGLTPPHRVKSISMASFTSDEVDFVKFRGNDSCRQAWLALYDESPHELGTAAKDELQIKDFMAEKYEKKRFYHDKTLANGLSTTTQAPTVPDTTATKPFTNGTNNNGSDFVADFNSADIFTATQFTKTNAATTTAQPSFANFDNNVIFNSATCQQSSYDLLMNQLTQTPNYVENKMWSMTSPPLVTTSSAPVATVPMFKVSVPPSEDRYAALKDLDNALKSQQQQEAHVEWNTSSSNGSGYGSSSQSGSLYGSPSQPGSMYGSPSQGNFPSAFSPTADALPNISNPFSTSNIRNNPWAPNSGSNGIHSTLITANTYNANPFRNEHHQYNGNGKMNGIVNNTNGFNGNQMAAVPQRYEQNSFNNISSQNVSFTSNKLWNAPNPFTLNGGNSNNPFL